MVHNETWGFKVDRPSSNLYGATMKPIFLLLTLAISTACYANQAAIATAKKHLNYFMRGNNKELAQTYSKEVTLKPGHEFLKEKYGLAGVDGRSKELTTPSKQLILAIKKAYAAKPARPEERINKMLNSVTYKILPTTKGDFIIPSSDPVGTPDGKLHFSILADDLMIKISPPKGDFILLQLRKKDDSWTVVAEYLD